MLRDQQSWKITTLPGNLLNSNTKVKDRKGLVRILWDIPPWLLQLPIMIQTVLNAVTPRIMTKDARSRNIEIDGSIGRRMPRNNRTVEMVEGALTYTDWRLEVEEYIAKKYPRPKIKEAMFISLEGKVKRNYQACDERGDLSLVKILEKMDMIYGISVSFWDLNAKLCGLKQGAQESPKDYYERMVDISVALKEYHGDWFQPRELAWMKKQCFFAGLQENYKYLVSHLKDQDDVDPVLMLKEIRECDESQYLANTSHPPKSTNDGPAKNTNYYDKKNYDRQGYGNYTAWAANVPDDPDNHESDSLSDEASEKENDDVQQDRSYHVGVMFTADEGEAFFGKCYNCGEPGHP